MAQGVGAWKGRNDASPPGVRSAGSILPSRSHRLSVSGCTPSSAAATPIGTNTYVYYLKILRNAELWSSSSRAHIIPLLQPLQRL